MEVLKIKDIVEIYKNILNGELRSFPAGTWENTEDGRDRFRRCFRYLNDTILHYTSNEDFHKITNKIFKKYKLYGAYQALFDSSPYAALICAYPELQIKPWEMDTVARNYWSETSNVVEAVRWLVLEKLKWGREDIVSKFDHTILEKHGFGAIHSSFRSNPELTPNRNGKVTYYDILARCLPEYDFKFWEFKVVHGKTEAEKREFLREVFEKRLSVRPEEITAKIFRKNLFDLGLKNYLETYHDGSLYKAVLFAYPDMDWSELKLREIRRANNGNDYEYHRNRKRGQGG